MENFEIIRIESGKSRRMQFPVSEEIPLSIEVNGKEIVTLLCTPQDLEFLAVGFLFSSGFFDDYSSVKKVSIDTERWKASVVVSGGVLSADKIAGKIYTSGFGKGVIFQNPLDIANPGKFTDNNRFHLNKINHLMKDFLNRSEEHKLTRGVHSSALATEDKIVAFKDDIGRHNTVDKIIGEAIVHEISLSDKMILTSGRLSSENILKTLRCGCSMLVSAGSPTNQAVRLAKSINLTLIGLARDDNMNIYAGEHRVIYP